MTQHLTMEKRQTSGSPYTYALEALTHEENFKACGAEFSVVCAPEVYHPSNWSFRDEVETRERWWKVGVGDVVLDIGADFGSYSLPALALGAAQVFAWSPPYKLPHIPFEAMALRLSAWNNKFEDRLTVYDSGLWSERGWLALFDGPRPAKFFGSRAEAFGAIREQPGHVSAFAVKALDDSQLRTERIDWIKIDTEGCELEILRGARQTILTFKPRIMLENHYHLDAECESKCDSFLAELGYEKLGTRPVHLISHSLYAPKRS